MKLFYVLFLSLAIAFSFAEEIKEFGESVVVNLEDDFDVSEEEALVEFQPDAERQDSKMKGCKEIGERCDGNIGDCNCCRSSGVCKCSWIDWSYCTCQVGSAADNWGTCLRKNRECNAGYDCGKRPCTRKGCKNQG